MLTLILWGNAFDGEFAVSALSALRRAQIQTKLIGIYGRQSSDALGIGLCSDLTLGQAMSLAEQAKVIIVPCHTPNLSVIELDPRVAHFLSVSHQHGARLITGLILPKDATLFPCPLHRLEMWSDPTRYHQLLDSLIQALQTTPTTC